MDIIQAICRGTDHEELNRYMNMVVRKMKEESDVQIEKIIEEEIISHMDIMDDVMKRAWILYVLNEDKDIQRWAFQGILRSRDPVPKNIQPLFLGGLSRLCTAYSEKKLTESKFVKSADSLYESLLSNRIRTAKPGLCKNEL